MEAQITAETPKSRGTLLTIVSLFLALGAILSLAAVPSNFAASLGLFYQIALAVSAIITGVAAYGIWLNQKWGAHTYIGLTIFNQPFLLLMGWWVFGALLIPGIVVVCLLFKLKSMQ
jgi:hypothetical protein